MTDKRKSKQKKEIVEEPIIDKTGESLKKLISKGKKNGFLKRSECENALINESFDDKEEFFSKVELDISESLLEQESKKRSNISFIIKTIVDEFSLCANYQTILLK